MVEVLKGEGLPAKTIEVGYVSREKERLGLIVATVLACSLVSSNSLRK